MIIREFKEDTREDREEAFNRYLSILEGELLDGFFFQNEETKFERSMSSAWISYDEDNCMAVQLHLASSEEAETYRYLLRFDSFDNMFYAVKTFLESGEGNDPIEVLKTIAKNGKGKFELVY